VDESGINPDCRTQISDLRLVRTVDQKMAAVHGMLCMIPPVTLISIIGRVNLYDAKYFVVSSWQLRPF
jgi:hypothetical protein